jgi:hypothetical protein
MVPLGHLSPPPLGQVLGNPAMRLSHHPPPPRETVSAIEKRGCQIKVAANDGISGPVTRFR